MWEVRPTGQYLSGTDKEIYRAIPLMADQAKQSSYAHEVAQKLQKRQPLSFWEKLLIYFHDLYGTK